MKKIILFVAGVLAVANPSYACMDLHRTDFNPGSAELTLNTINRLNDAIRSVKKVPKLLVEIAGHTDLCPGQDHMKLSTQRAEAVADYLRKNGFPMNQVTRVKGYGDTRPIENTPRDYPSCRSRMNDRVELNVQN